jgi:large subunit ribosomal protein L28
MFQEGASSMQKCDYCDRKPGRGNSKVERGKAKYLGGNGRKTTGITKRYFFMNLQHVHIEKPEGGAAKAIACTKCIRSGKVIKSVKRKPFTLAEAS